MKNGLFSLCLLQMRMLYGLRDYTDHHQDILVDLYNLSVSRYGEVGNNDADLWNQKPILARRIKFNVEFCFFKLYFHHEFYIGLSFLECVVISLYTVGEEEGPIRADAVLPELPLLLPVLAGQNIQQSHPEGYARKTVQGKSRIQGKKHWCNVHV